MSKNQVKIDKVIEALKIKNDEISEFEFCEITLKLKYIKGILQEKIILNKENSIII